MKHMKEFTIPFVGLKQGEHHFEYKIDNTFFSHFEYDEFNNVAVLAKALLIKKSNSLEFQFSINGIVNVNCDVTNEPYDQMVEGTHYLVVNFGDEYNDEDDTLLVVPQGTYEVNIQQYIYELIILSLPARRVHPGVEDGTLNSEILDKLKELTPKETEEQSSKNEIDPRWDELKKLLTDK
ncbi:MAG: DUF177 domain-containing protein [Flavobacteriaceae bacterium]|nr:DUF177 domain-containing protein [Flavobacteriaceae bacterium]